MQGGKEIHRIETTNLHEIIQKPDDSDRYVLEAEKEKGSFYSSFVGVQEVVMALLFGSV